jgi:hypothetical protein
MAMNAISIPVNQGDSIMLQSTRLPALLGLAMQARRYQKHE